MHLHCVVYYDKTWVKTILTCFTKMIAEQLSLTQYERPMLAYIPYERKINMLSSTDNNFMICLFDFERASIGSRFPFFSFFFTHTVYPKPKYYYYNPNLNCRWIIMFNNFDIIMLSCLWMFPTSELGRELSIILWLINLTCIIGI